MGWLETAVDWFNNILWTYILIALLVGAGLYFTFSTKFVQFRLFGEMFRLITEKKKKRVEFLPFKLLQSVLHLE